MTMAGFKNYRVYVGLAALALTAAIAAVGVAAHRDAKAAATAPQAEEKKSAGERLYDGGAYRDAVEALRAEFRAAPTERTKRLLVRALLGTGDALAALELLRVDAPLSSAEGAMLRAEAFLRLGRAQDAEAETETFAAEAPGAAALYRARSAFLDGDDAAARRLTAEALRAGGYAGDAWMFRARTALSENDFAAADAATARAKEAGAPARALALLAAEKAIRRGDNAAAAASLGPEDPGRADDVYLRAMAEVASGDFKAAVLRLRAISQALVADPRSRLLAAFAREGGDDLSQAEVEFRRAAEAAPRDPAVQDALAAFLLRHGRIDDAQDAIAALAAIAPAAARARQAEAYERAGDVGAALATWVGGAAERFPSRARILGVAAIDPSGPADRRLDAMAAAAAALRGDGPGEPALTSLQPYARHALPALLIGELALARGDLEGAARAFRDSAAARPSFRAALGAARAAARAGDAATARKEVDAAFAARPDDLARRVATARLRLGGGDAAAAVALLDAAADAVIADDRALVLYAEAAQASPGALRALVDRLRKAGRESAAVSDAFLRAGNADEAEATARRALLADARDDAALASFLRAAAARQVATAETAAFLDALRRRTPDAAGLGAVVARLKDGGSATEALALLDMSGPKGAARVAYLADPADLAAVRAYAFSALGAGETRRGAALLREACFWGAKEACPATAAAADR